VPPILELRAVSKRFGGVTALDGVDFALSAGEVHGLIGENGAGKSTMMKLLAGVHADYEGEIRVDGRPVRFGSPAEAQAAGVGMVYQELSAFAHLTVAENLFGRQLPVRRGLVDWRGMNRMARAQLAELGLDIDVTHTMGQLPVGHQQLVEISRVIRSGARVIILDEPTSALSRPETERLFAFIARLKAQGRTLVFISHFLEDVLAVTDRITVLRNGRKVADLETPRASKQGLITLMIGAEAAAAPPPTPSAAGAQVLVARGLGRRDAFAGVDLALREGEVLGLFAFMGAGQHQLAQCLFGAARATSGEILLDGRPLRLRRTSQARDLGIGYVPEDRRTAIMGRQPVYRNITLAHLGTLLPGWLDERRERAIAGAQIAALGVRPADPDLPVGALSGGNQQKVVLARWLTRQPRVLILNEPTRGLDVGAKEEVSAIVRRLRRQGVAILLVTTEPEAILALADRAMVMRRGRITASLAGETLTKEDLIKSA
jgi:ribose transport system ATP-binding protein